MGCKSSKLEESKLVSLCRERRKLIAAAVDRRYALAAAHAAYFDALDSVGDALQRFVQEELTVASSSSPPWSPVLTLPSSDGKGKTKSSKRRSAATAASVCSSVTALSHSLSLDASHLPLSSISESSDPDGGDGGASEAGGSGGAAGDGDGGGDASSSPLRHIFSLNSNPSFMKSSMEIPQTVYQDPFAPPWSNSPYNGYGYRFGYPPYDVPIGSAAPPRDENFGLSTPTVAPATPPPPLPAKTSGWEFFDPFNTYEHFVHHYAQGKLRMGSFTSSPDLSEVRKQEGIPDLEFKLDVEPMKEAKKDNVKAKKENVLDNDLGTKDSSIENLEAVPAEDVERKDEKNTIVGLAEEGRKNSWASIKGKSGGEDEESNGKRRAVTFDDKSHVTAESALNGGKSLSTTSSGQSFFLHATRDVVDAVKEIKEQFTSAADCGEEVSRMLEVEKFPYHSRSRKLGDISSRILDPIALPVLAPLRPSKRPQHTNMSTVSGEAGDDNPENNVIVKSRNLSSTLEKLYLWEKKLYKEVKGEEKLRIIYDQKYKQLKALGARGAESSKIDMTRILVRKLHTKISVIIKSVNSISNRMHKIRDEELQPQLTELIQGFIRMWKTVLDCHHKQLQAIVNSKSHKLMVKTRSQKESVAKATKELELELINWYRCFKDWIDIQKSYVKALNGWLISWLPQEQEHTLDGVAPFSPSRVGAPAVFVLSNDWSHASKNISGKNVIEAMRAFIAILRILSESQKEEQRQRFKAEYLSGAYDRRLESLQENGTSGHLDIVSVTEDGLEHHDDGMVKLDSLRKRLDERKYKHQETLKQIRMVASSTLQAGLTPLFEALGNFTSEMLRAYDGLRIPDEGGKT